MHICLTILYHIFGFFSFNINSLLYLQNYSCWFGICAIVFTGYDFSQIWIPNYAIISLSFSRAHTHCYVYACASTIFWWVEFGRLFGLGLFWWIDVIDYYFFFICIIYLGTYLFIAINCLLYLRNCSCCSRIRAIGLALFSDTTSQLCYNPSLSFSL